MKVELFKWISYFHSDVAWKITNVMVSRPRETQIKAGKPPIVIFQLIKGHTSGTITGIRTTFELNPCIVF